MPEKNSSSLDSRVRALATSKKSSSAGALSETLMVQVPAMVLAMEAVDAFEDLSAKPQDQLHEIETYGPVGFDFVELEETQPNGPFPISERILDAIENGQADIELAMAAFWDDVPKVIALDPKDSGWIEQELASLAFDPIDQIDLSFGVEELPLDAFFPDVEAPIVDDFFA